MYNCTYFKPNFNLKFILPPLQHLLDQAEGAIGVDPDLILDTVALCHDSHQAVLDRFI